MVSGRCKHCVRVEGRRARTRAYVNAVAGGVALKFDETNLSPELWIGMSWAPGREILYPISAGPHEWRLMNPTTGAKRVLGAEQPLGSPDIGGCVYQTTYSPDATRVAVLWHQVESGVWILSASDTTRRLLVKGNFENPHVDAWSSLGDSLLVHDFYTGELRLVSATDGGGRFFAEYPSACTDESHKDYTLDLKLLTCQEYDRESDAWSIENFDPAVAARSR